MKLSESFSEIKYKGGTIHETAVIGPNVTIGKNTYIGPFCVIGMMPEHADHLNKDCGVVIGDNCVLYKAVVVDSGIFQKTAIEDGCHLKSGSHVGHDARLCAGVTLAPKAVVGGHSVGGVEANLGIGAVIHQKVMVPGRCMIGMNAVVTKKAAEKMEVAETWAGVPAKKIGMNKKWL